MNSSSMAKCDLPGFLGLLLWILSIALLAALGVCMVVSSFMPVGWDPFSFSYTMFMIGLFVFCASNIASFLAQTVIRAVSFSVKGMHLETLSKSSVPILGKQLISFKCNHFKNYYFFRIDMKKGPRAKNKRSYVFVCNLAHLSDEQKALFLGGLDHMSRLWQHQQHVIQQSPSVNY